jgi:multiple sugar transport system permease protein
MTVQTRPLSTAGTARSRASAARRRASPVHRGDAGWALLLLAPSLVGLGVFFIWPIIQTFYFSMTSWSGLGLYEWTGLDNYRRMIADGEVWRSILNTIILTLLTLVGVPLAVIAASLLSRPGLVGRSLYRTLYFLPVVTLPSAVSIVWEFIYDGDHGILNYLLSLVGLPGTFWLANPDTALVAVSVVAVWSGFGFNVVILLAGMQGIPVSYYEASELDGATKLQQFLHVTVPLLTPSIFFVTIITVINSFQTFDLIYLMIGKGNPALESSQTIIYLFYKSAFEDFDGGYGSALVVLVLAIILILTMIQFRLQKRWVHYG